MEDTVRDVMKDRLRDALNDFIKHLSSDIDEFTCDVADEVFSVCGISEKEQDEPWKT